MTDVKTKAYVECCKFLGDAFTANGRYEKAIPVYKQCQKVANELDLQDFVALSFVREADDVIGLRQLIQEYKPDADVCIISKIEKPQAIENIDAIIDASDGIMVARGDLGIEIPSEKV